jgi:hypothetical protein
VHLPDSGVHRRRRADPNLPRGNERRDHEKYHHHDEEHVHKRAGHPRGIEGASPMTDPRIDEELAEAILAAITEARENGIPEERIIEMLAEIVKGLREGLS